MTRTASPRILSETTVQLRAARVASLGRRAVTDTLNRIDKITDPGSADAVNLERILTTALQIIDSRGDATA